MEFEVCNENVDWRLGVYVIVNTVFAAIVDVEGLKQESWMKSGMCVYEKIGPFSVQ